MVAVKTVQKIVREILATRFPKIKIVTIKVVEDEDYVGTSLLRIDITFKAKDGDFDPARMRELPRLIMPKLKEAEETKDMGFPLLSFIAASELGKHKSGRARAN